MFSALSHNLAPWSVSKAKLASTCALAFRYRYIEHLPEQVTSPEARVGTAAHEVLERVERGAALDASLGAVATRLELSAEERARLEALAGAIGRFLDTISAFRARGDVRQELCEERLGVDDELRPTGFLAPDVFFRGAVDLAFVLGDGRVALIDHKSSRKKDLKWHASQLKGYAVLAFAHFPELRKVCSGIHFLGDGELVWGRGLSADEIRKSVRDWFVAWIDDAAIRGSQPDPKPQVSAFCDYCGYRPVCPAHGIEVKADGLVQLRTRRHT